MSWQYNKLQTHSAGSGAASSSFIFSFGVGCFSSITCSTAAFFFDLAGVLRGDFLGDSDRFLAAAGAVVPIERLLERVRDPILSALATESPLLFLLFFAAGMFGRLVMTSSASSA